MLRALVYFQGWRLVRLFIVFGLCAWGTWETRYWFKTDLHLVPALLAFITICLGLGWVYVFFVYLYNTYLRRDIMRSTERCGSAGWCSAKEIRKAGLHKKRGFLMGMIDEKPIFANIESSGLILSPAGGGKTVGFVIPALCLNTMSMIVPDLKAILACMTSTYRKKKFKHKIITLNPGGLFHDILGAGSHYNPLQILIDDWRNPRKHQHLFSDAQSIAKQLCQDPPTQGENQYWRNGSRKFLTFVFLYLVTIKEDATLAKALCLLSDTEELINSLNIAKTSPHLNGDLARLAKDLLIKFEQGDVKQMESFREGAVQALDVFSPSGTLADCTSKSDFRFADAKKTKMTIYIIADPTRMNVYSPWLGLISWCALTELMRYSGGNPVCFLCDEVTNFKIEGLPSLLTLAREFKIILWLIVQELEQWAHVYGRESLETLLSQTEVKLIMGTRSYKTCQLVSSMLGEESLKSLNYNLGKSVFDPITSSVQEGPRKLLTADEVRRCEDSILFVRDMKPILGQKIGFHEISPMRRKVGINPHFGKRYKGKVKLRV